MIARHQFPLHMYIQHRCGVLYHVEDIAACLQNMWGCVHDFSLACLHFHCTREQICVTAQAIFRSVSKLLMDTATSEYLFCCSFFQDDAIFHELFAATLTVVESSLAAMLQVRSPLTACCGPSRAIHKLFRLQPFSSGIGITHLMNGKNPPWRPTACHACLWR